MKKTITNVFLFATGAAIGSLVTWKVVKTKYERIAQEEIDSVKETWARLMREEVLSDISHGDGCDDKCSEDCEENEDYNPDKTEVVLYHKLVNTYGVSGEETENDGKGEGDEEVPYVNGPVVIMPEDYGDGNYNHSLYCLTYYSDGILANDWNETFDIEETIGEESLKHFGDYTEDVVHVRNERLNGDYEIVRDDRRYADIVASMPLAHAYAD